MKLETIVNNANAIAELGKLKLKNKQLAWDLSENLDAVQKHFKKYGEQNKELVEKHGTPAEESPGEFEIKADSEKMPAYKKEHEALLEVDVKLIFKKLKYGSVGEHPTHNDTCVTPNKYNWLLRKVKTLI